MCRKRLRKGELIYEHDFRSGIIPPEFHAKDHEIYNTNNTAFFKKNVEVIPGIGLVIKCYPEEGIVHSWSGDYPYKFSSGCLTTWNKNPEDSHLLHAGGIWEIEAEIPQSWAAIWLLHPDYEVEGYSKEFIIPEVDIAENNGGKIDNCVHYGYSNDKYRTDSKVRKMHRPDYASHKYAVEILPNGYDFYMDGVRKTKFRSRDEDFVAYEQPYYIIINNASDARFPVICTNLFVKTVKIYDHENN